MQIIVQYASELVVAIGMFLAALLLFRFTSNRIKQLPDEEKSLGRPLWVATVSIILFGIASLFNFQYALAPSVELETVFYLVVVVGAAVVVVVVVVVVLGIGVQLTFVPSLIPILPSLSMIAT